MKAEIAEVVMNPVRQRIIQYLLVHEKGTVKEIKKNCRMFRVPVYIVTLKY